MARRERGRNSGGTRVREGGGKCQWGRCPSNPSVLPPIGWLTITTMGGDDGWRCHLAALLWDITLVCYPLRNRFSCLWMGRAECVFSAAWGDKMMEVEGTLLIWTPLRQFTSALLLRRRVRRSRSTLRRRCLSDRAFTMWRRQMRRAAQ